MAVRVARQQGLVRRAGWDEYQRLLIRLDDGTRATYDNGRLELMTVDTEHERKVRLLSALVEACLWHQGRRFVPGGTTTFRRRDKKKGFEPDNCYWLSNPEHMLGVKKWDHTLHPPPDLALEVTVTHGVIKRLPIYAAMGIPEVWWYHDGELEVLRLSDDGTYRRVPASPTFPSLPLPTVVEHLQLFDKIIDSEIPERFRAWLNESERKPR